MKVSPSSEQLLELQRRLVSALLRPAVRLGRRFHLPLGLLEDLVRVAYYQELRQGGQVSQVEVARLAGLSLRTIGSLERQHRAGLAPTADELALQRHVEELLATEGPLALSALVARLPAQDPDDVARMVDGLVGAGRLTADRTGTEPHYATNHHFISLVRADVEARLDGLSHQLDVVEAAVEGRFLRRDPRALARTLSFVATPAAMEKLFEVLPQAFRQACAAAEEESLEVGGFHSYGATLAVAPLEPEKES